MDTAKLLEKEYSIENKTMFSGMNNRKTLMLKGRYLLLITYLLIAAGVSVAAQEPNETTALKSIAVAHEPNGTAAFKQEELDQLLAPIALYPDALLSQILMASTYPLDIVQAQRWADQNRNLTGDALTTELEKQTWDPSVKSLVNFPQVLTMLSEKIDWTQKLGDAFLAQQKDVMATVQKLRKKAEEQGNLKTTKEQVIKVEQETIIIESADPKVVYVPTYNTTVVYGTWWYPAYPPYYYYPPGYVVVTPYSFAAGVAVGAAWGYAWGHCDWHGGDIDVDIDRNFNFNQNIDRGKYAEQYRQRGSLDQGGKGKWQHNPENRKGVPYRDQATAQRYNHASTADAIKSREAYRGRAEQGRQDLARGGVNQLDNRQGAAQQPRMDQRPASRDMNSNISNRGGAFQGMDSGNTARNMGSRGQMSRQGMSAGGGMRGGGGGMRGGGGGGRR
jgi:hypothetical protein